MLALFMMAAGLAAWLLFSRRYPKLPRQLVFVSCGFFLAFLGIKTNVFVFDLNALARNNFVLNLAKMTPITVLSIYVLGFIKYGQIFKLPRPASEFYLVALLYPLYGVAQQIFTLAFIYPNLKEFFPIPLAIFLTSFYYALFHFPNRTLTGIVFIGELVIIPLYLFFVPNIFVMGISQGLFATFLYYLILQDNVWKRKVKKS